MVLDRTGNGNDGALGSDVPSRQPRWVTSTAPVNILATTGFQSPLGDFSTLVRNADGTYTRTLKDSTQSHFNARGLLTSVVDRNGNTTSYSYDPNERLISITDPVGLVTTLSYANGRLAGVTDPAGRITRFEQDAAGNLIRITDPDGSTRQFGYDAHHRLMTQINKRGFSTTYHYNFAGRITKVVRPDGSTNEISPSETVGLIDPASDLGTADNPAPFVRPEQEVSNYTDGNGNKTTFRTDRFGGSTETIDALGRRTGIARDENGNATRIFNPNGATTTMTYDERGNVLSVTIEELPPSRLSCGNLFEGEISGVGEVDTVTFFARTDDAVAITLATTAAIDQSFFAYAELFSPSGVSVLGTYFTGQREFQLTETGSYTIKVFENILTRRGRYALSLECLKPPNPTATLLDCGDTWADSLEIRGDTDLFTFPADSGHVVAITLATTGAIDPSFFAYAELFSPSGVSVLGTYFTGQREFQLTETGSYTIKVFENILTRRGRYALSLECLKPPNAMPLACGQIIADSINAAADADVFTFIARKGDVVSITLLTTAAFDQFFDARYDLFSPTG
ncbi:MAG: hypothetical protein ACRENG_21570, partial [bacterium]